MTVSPKKHILRLLETFDPEQIELAFILAASQSIDLREELIEWRQLYRFLYENLWYWGEWGGERPTWEEFEAEYESKTDAERLELLNTHNFLERWALSIHYNLPVPWYIGKCHPKLHTINLSHYTYFPWQIATLGLSHDNIQCLRFDKCSIDEWPPFMEDLCKNVVSIDFENCQISTEGLGELLSYCPRLGFLSIKSCVISRLPEEVTQLSALQRLVVWYSNIKELPDLSSLQHLTDIDLYSNRFRHFPEMLFRIPNLKNLNFTGRGNKILGIKHILSDLKQVWEKRYPDDTIRQYGRSLCVYLGVN